jgi:AcrR family transcriptional regulator
MHLSKAKPATDKMQVDAAPADEGTRERILTTAMQLYAEGGLEQVSMRAIGGKLGVSQMMAYRYFKSKDEIFAEIRGRVFENFASYLESAIERSTAPFPRLVRYCYAYVEFGKQAPADYRFIFDLWPRSQYEIVVRQEGSQVLERTRAFSIQLQIASEMLGADINSRQVMECAHVVWQTLHGLVALHTAKKLGFGMNVDDLVKPTINSIVNGLFGNGAETGPFRRPPLPVAVGLISAPA